ncbi:MAG TPA: amino acid adenylation domain-containing protein [Longimicrobiaceae bacterium]|nr:amino acid adenylation domain-containing protein [Longimicrobiaceae bacterium]
MRELRRAAGARLPEYMVPGAFVPLAALPLTPNGKLDRGRLPSPDQASAGRPHLAPRTPAEAALAGIWAEVLARDTVGVEANFFELGGHSLLAMRVISRVRAVFGVELPVHAMFEAPTVAELAERVEALRRAEVRLLPLVAPVERDGPVPLSFAQERLWFLDRMQPGSAFYNIPAVRRLGGALDGQALARALGEIVRRHEALRTTFAEAAGVPVQVVAPFAGFTLPVEDLSGQEGPEREAEVRRLAREDAARPFDLAAGPLFRAKLLRLGEEEHVLLLCMHHVVSDGWSMGVLFRELSALYAAYREGRESPLAELPVQYADYAVWQREQLRGEILERQLAYWKERLAGAPEMLELPTDHSRPAVQTYRGTYERVQLPLELLERLQAVGRSEGATLFMVLLGAFQVLLSKYSGSEDVVVGSPIAGRTRGEVEGLIGFFVNTLVLRTDLSGDPGFRQVLHRVREATLGAYEHQDVPFERLVEELQPERSLSHSPLFQVLFVADGADGTAGGLSGLDVQGVGTENDTAKFDLSLYLAATPRGLAGGLNYSTDLFERSTIRRMLGHLERVLEQVAADAGARLSALVLPGEAEQEQVLRSWNRTDRSYPDTPVHVLFAEHARRAPDAVALLHEGEAVTYRALDRRADALAARLRELGVGPEVPVGLCMERTPELLVGALGIWKAGGAYVPLDPGYPPERLGWMVSDAALPVVVTAGSAADALPEHGAAIVRSDETCGGPADEAVRVPVSASNLVYVIYTSGSTGRPKGVLVQHGSLANLLGAMREVLGVGEGDVMPALASFAFDIWLLEALLPLTSGAAVRLVGRERMLDVPALLDEAADATLLHAVPALMREVAQVGRGASRPGRLRHAFVGGDRVPPDLLAEMRAAFPGAESYVLYGPTEGTVLASIHPVPEDGVVGGHPIGRPLGNVRLYVCDPLGRPQPAGVPGELLIGGAGVARGYLGRAALTAERFVPDPFGAPGGRLYRTGDRVRWRADGTLEFLGRVDRQVKVRGFRIEPGEIEAVMRRQPGVRECVVAVREEAPGGARLVAYVVGEVDAEALRGELHRGLPEYMVPAAFVALDHLPLTPNGKLDVKALPAPDFAAGGHHVAPRTPTEEVLAGIWAEVLRLERVGVGENFFELGGHSLLAMRVVSRVREVFGIELPVRALFEGPTVAELAGRVEALRRAELPVLPPVVPVERRGALPLSFAQERLWFLDRMQPGTALYNILSALRLQGALDAAALERALGEVVRRHEALRTVFAERDGEAVQVVVPFTGYAMLVEDLSSLGEEEREAEVRHRVAEDAVRPFDLSAGPLFRAGLLRLGSEDHVLLLSVHHIVSDGWSTGVLFRELSALYEAYRAGRESPLPELPIQYADYAVWQRRQLRGEGLERQLAWWKERLSGAPALLELPTDRPRPAVQTYRGASEPVRLSPELRDRLQALARGEGATLYMVLLGAFQVLLSKYSGSGDVVVGSPTAGRTHREVEGLIGFFVNALVLRTDLSGDPAFRQVLRSVREATLGAYEHQDVSFEKLVAELQAERSLSHAPIFQVSFALQNNEAPGGALPGLEVRRAGAAAEPAKLDLSLDLTETSDGLRGRLIYSTDLFERSTVRRMLGHLERVLEQVVADADVRLSGLELLGAAERALVVDEWNRTETPRPPDATIHQLFSAQAACTPDAEALRFGGRGTTYRELEEAANRLAHHLAARGVEPEARVGVFAERAPETVAAILAVLKAGGAYVPLDPAYPAERLRYMLADAGVRTVVAPAGVPDGVPAALLPDLLDLRAEARAIAARPADAPRVPVEADGAAYVIYTSGSTGAPKGAVAAHRGVPNLARAQAGRFGIDAASHVLQFASFSFDAAVSELFATLLSGATLVLATREETLPGPGLLDTLRRERITVVTLPPSVLAALEPDGLPELRMIVSAGEAVGAAVVERWSAGRTFVNAYGPTEATVCATTAACEADGRTPPIGRPLENVRVYVLDARREPVPVGLPGELFVGGVGVARGYLHRPELTAERFVPDPFGAGGGRLYRTGDWVRWRADGTLEYLGRLDEQVKVRGFRIEPAEVESALSAHPGVREARVVVREDEPGEKRLVAYLVGEAAADGLREHLRGRLPEYMVPAAFVTLDRLPLTPHGKLDRKALPAPEYATAGDRYVAPSNRVEEILAGIWAEVLGLERVGVNESFFELGGDSILCIQVVSCARREGLEITPPQMFEYQTIAELAAVAGDTAEAEAGHAEQGRVQGTVRLTPIQAWFFEQGHPAPWHYNQSALLEVDAGLGDAALEAALRAVLEHHDVFRLRYRRTASGWEQWHAGQVGIALERVDLADLPREAQERVQGEVAGRAQASLDLEQGPLGRALLFDRGERGRALLLVLHHLVVDGVSWRILRDDLERACAQAQAGEPIELGAKSTSYRQWAEALDAFAASDALLEEAGHWLAQGPEGVAPLPADGEGGRTIGGSRSVTVRLETEETRALLQEVPTAYRTQMNDVLLCALAETVGEWTGSSRVRLALEGHGREEEESAGVDLTRTVGWFTSVYPVVLDTAGTAGPGERLKRVKEQLRAVPRRGIGYGVLRYLGPDAVVRGALAAQPEPEISFNYLGQFDQGLAPAARLRSAVGLRGGEWAPENRRAHALEVNGSISGGCLRVRWTYGEGAHRPETIERLAGRYLDALRGLIAHCREEGAGGYTPSDFPLAGLAQAELDALLAGRRGVEDLYPLSPMQEGMLFHTLYSETQEYQTQRAERLEGAFDAELFRRAWAEAVRRHAVLRTSFAWEGLRRPLQRVETAVEVPWRTEDWRELTADAQDAALQRYLEEDRARGFALHRAPLLRFAVFRVGDQAHWLVWSQHHLLMDGWSCARIADEVFRLYHAWSTGQAVELGRRRPYRDYIAWLERQDQDAAERYWRQVLGGFTAPTPLGLDRAAPAGEAVRQAHWRAALSAGLTERLEQAARRGRVTLSTVLLGAWGFLLSRYGGEEEVVCGNTVSGRPAQLDGVEEMVGLFINTLPVRMRVPGDARLEEWLRDLQRTLAEAREFEYAPLVQVQGWSGVPRGTPLFETLFVFENYPVERGGSGGGEARLRVARTRAVEWDHTYPLCLTAAPGRQLLFDLSYDESRFEADTIKRVLEHLSRVLEQVAGGADVHLAELELLGEAERRLLVEEWNRTERAFPRGACIHELFQAQAEGTPDALAVVSEDGTLAYRELNERANQLAHYLRRRGVGPETRVAICVERGSGMALGILGALKAGGAYVPLDPEYPAEQLAYMLEDSGAAVLLTTAHLAGRLSAPAGVVCVDLEAEPISAESREAPESGISPESLAYVIYTSGSTGRPKGVALPHRALVNFATDMAGRLGLGPADRILQFASPSFDVVVEELFPAWVSGAAVVLSSGNLFAPNELLEVLERQGVTGFELPTAYWHEWVHELVHAGRRLPACVRFVIVGGERVLPERLAEWSTLGVPLVHVFGLTETACTSTTLRLEGGDDGSRWPSLPVGTPTGNVRIHLLDRSLHPVPIGVAGELFIGGEGVARGYLDRPGLTAARFVPDPFSARPGARLYRSGDRVRWLADGTLEFLGRLDDQVKIRGFRVEPGEVERALSAYPGVSDARVVVREDRPGERRLVAYVVGGVEPEALRAHLRRSLPEHMLPGAVVGLDQLPLTPNGKLDRKALPAPELPSAGDRYVAPRTPVEEVLAEIWAEVLGVERVGADDDFFALGGHSLLAIRVVSRIREIFAVELPLRALFDLPVLGELGALLATDPRYAGHAARVAGLLLQIEGMPAEPASPAVRT